MNFLSRRPAALCVTISLVFSFMAIFLGLAARIAIIAAAIAVPAVICLVFRNRPRRTFATMEIRAFSLVAGSMLILQMLTSIAVWDLSAGAYEKYSSSGSAADIEAVVIGVNSSSEWYANYRVELSEINGKRSFAVGLLTCETSYAFTIGDRISCRAVFTPLDEYNREYGSDRYSLMTDGVRFVCSPEGEPSVTGHSRYAPRVVLARLRERIRAAISLFADHETSGFVKALILSDRSGLGRMRRDMSRVGASHLLALSGLHLTAISVVVDRFLLGFMISKPKRGVVKIICAFGFMAVSGFPHSLARAAIMMTIAIIAETLSQDRDRITALFLAAWIIVLVDPPAILDVGLQMSFCATLGVIFAMNAEVLPRRRVSRKLKPLKKTKPRLAKQLKKASQLFFGALVTLGATLFVVPLQWVYFGEMSLLSIPSTIILSPLITLALWLAIPYTLFALVGSFPLAAPLGSMLTVLTKLIKSITSWMSLSRSVVPLGYWFSAVTFVVCILAAMIFIKPSRTSFLKKLTVFLLWIILYTDTVQLVGVIGNRREVIFTSSATSDGAIIAVGNQCMLINVEDGNNNIARNAVDIMNRRCLPDIGIFALTRLSRAGIRSARDICERKMVRVILIPKPENAFEEGCAAGIAEVASEYSAKLAFYERPDETTISFFGTGITFFEKRKLSRSTKNPIGIMFDLDGSRLLYSGASYWEVDPETHGAAAIVIGNAGPKVKTDPPYDPSAVTIKYLSDGNIAFTG